MIRDYDFDRTLNEALGEYRNAEPLSGIEERVLARLRLAKMGHTPVKRWYVLAAITALLVVVLLVGRADFQSQRVLPPVVSRQVTALPQAKLPTAVTKERSRAAQLRAEPKQQRVLNRKAVAQDEDLTASRFQRTPVQEPLSTQERTLIALAQANPELLKEATRDGTQIAISPINIRPLQMDTLNTGEN